MQSIEFDVDFNVSVDDIHRALRENLSPAAGVTVQLDGPAGGNHHVIVTSEDPADIEKIRKLKEDEGL